MAKRTLKEKARRRQKRPAPDSSTAKSTGRRGADVPATGEPAPAAPDVAELDPAQKMFIAEYLVNGFNATQAWLKVHPHANYASARTEGWRQLTKADVRAELNPRLEAAWKAVQMGGEEALARVGRDASAKITDLYDGNGALLEPHQWPESVAGSVKSVQHDSDGVLVKVTLVDGLHARRIILEQSGKIKGVADSIDALAEAIRTDTARKAGTL